MIAKYFILNVVFMLTLNDFNYAFKIDQLILPNSFTALSDDLHVQIQILNTNTIIPNNNISSLQYLIINKLNLNLEKELIDNITLPVNISLPTNITTSCKNIFRGGHYEILLMTNNLEVALKENLTVKWPIPQLYIDNKKFGTYPDSSVNVQILFPDIKCDVKSLNSNQLPQFYLELIFCGKDFNCDHVNVTTLPSSLIYSEKITGMLPIKIVQLKCELFGLAGHYVIQLRPLKPTPSYIMARDYLFLDWNEKFVFNVHARSIFPCDSHTGIGVLFEYPACIIDQTDRIRVFAKLRADVSSLKPPTSMFYITEHRVKKGQHSFHFDCEFFSEKYIEYCFVYVSQAISGAVADIRMDCVPTLSVMESDTGGWGPWSAWTPCSTNCLSGTRNRYRFCDSPPPRYGAKFCEGPAVETENCSPKNANSLECIYGIKSISSSQNSTTDLINEIGPGCRCGCIIHLGSLKPSRLLAASAQSCPGRSFWLIQADKGEVIKLKIEYSHLSCVQQYIKVRDGDSLSSNLLLQLVGMHKNNCDVIISSGSQMLFEFVSNDLDIYEKCKGSFLAKVQQVSPNNINEVIKSTETVLQKSLRVEKLTIINIAGLLFASFIIFTSALLGAQYIHRYKKYHLTNNKMGGNDSPLSTPRSSLGSIHNLPTRAISTSTLLSEVIYLVKLRPRNRIKHSILRESTVSDKIVSTEDSTKKCHLGTPTSPYQYAKAFCVDNFASISQCRLKSVSCENLAEKFKNESNIKASTDILKRKLLRKNDETINCVEKLSYLSTSDATLTNGCYSPAASIISTATIRTTNEKEKKDKKNKAKLLSRPNSEFSLSNQGELELDYYDYNVTNAGAAPGSYLGMDPAYLVWIPPISEGNILDEVEDENISKNLILENSCKKDCSSKEIFKRNYNSNETLKELHDENSEQKFETIFLTNLMSNKKIENSLRSSNLKSKLEASHLEKETEVVKSPSDFQDFYEMDDIKFADDEDGDC